MLQSFMWSTFEKTGNIDAYLSFKEIEKLRAGTGTAVNWMEEPEGEELIIDT